MAVRQLPPTNGGFDPTATRPPKLVKHIQNLEFTEMAKLLLLEAWSGESLSSDQGQPHRRPHRLPVTDILLWLECFSMIASVLRMEFPDKAAEFWAYQTSIIKAARNFKGNVWVAYDHQYRREVLVKRDLN